MATESTKITQIAIKLEGDDTIIFNTTGSIGNTTGSIGNNNDKTIKLSKKILENSKNLEFIKALILLREALGDGDNVNYETIKPFIEKIDGFKDSIDEPQIINAVDILKGSDENKYENAIKLLEGKGGAETTVPVSTTDTTAPASTDNSVNKDDKIKSLDITKGGKRHKRITRKSGGKRRRNTIRQK